MSLPFPGDGPGVMRRSQIRREEREALEEQQLVGGATRSRGAGDRHRLEDPDPSRTCFERDRDRILHSASFRRLAGKTQVFIFPEDHQRTRLTHALEVAQIATSVAGRCGLNIALTHAISLGHDCGHGPGGHAAEDALSPYLSDGFDHGPWGADEVLKSLNLCAETLDGIRNHSWSRPTPSTPEAVLVRWADRIAYCCHDLEDALSARVLEPDDIPRPISESVGSSRAAQLDRFITALASTISTTGLIGLPPDLAETLAAMRRFNHERIYLRPESLRQSRLVAGLLQALVEHFAERPGQIPRSKSRADEIPEPFSGDALISAVRWVAGMTDRFACEQAVRQIGWSVERLPLGLGLR